MDKKELLKLFNEALAILNNIDLQNKIIASAPQILEEFLPDFIKERYAMGEIDHWSNAKGEFGRTPTNPILVNRTFGEVTYFSRLLNQDNQRMIFHRIGSIEGALDAFELVSVDGKFCDILFADMYHYHCSKEAPLGYTLLEELDGITGTSENNPAFPERVIDTLIETAIDKFGAPILSKTLLDFDKAKAAALLSRARSGYNMQDKIVAKTTI